MVVIPTVLYFGYGTLRYSELAVGMVISQTGVSVRAVSIRSLGRFYSRNVGIQFRHELFTACMYRYIRHPGYSGTLLTFMGFAIATGLPIAVLANLVLFASAYLYRIQIEERL